MLCSLPQTTCILSIARQYIVERIPTLSLPDVCTLVPVHGKAFCARHCEVLESHCPPIPTDITGFLRFCGVLNNEGASYLQSFVFINFIMTCQAQSVKELSQLTLPI